MMVTFIAEKPTAPELNIPFFEDAKEANVPGRRTEKSIKALQNEIADLLLKMGAGAVVFVPGQYPGQPKRYGFQITFSLNGIPGRLDVAALPMKSETLKKKDRALAQALFLVRNWLESEVWSAVYRPGAIALVPYLIGNDGRTVTESLIESKALPMLGSGS